MKQTILLGLSGGIDSLVASILLKEDGFEVIGITFQMWEEQDVSQAIDLSKKLEIKHMVYDVSKDFKNKIVVPFVDTYFEGRTPNPCFVCNSKIKWNYLGKLAKEQGIKHIATGHYFRIKKEKDGYCYVCRGKDPKKDQSYFLWDLEQQQLERAVAPLGDYTKEEIRLIAKKYGYDRQSEGKESMSICFLEGMSYKEYLITNYEKKFSAIGNGLVKNINGEIIGKHAGYPFYTIGQKKGLNTSPRGLSVLNINAGQNEITAGLADNLWTDTLQVKNCKFVSPNLNKDGLKAHVKIRGIGLNPKKEASFVFLSPTEAVIRLEDPAWAVASGQPVVFYSQEKVIGGAVQV